MVRLLLVRHAATEASKENRLLGATDAAVSAEGLEELQRLPLMLDSFRPDVWYCSPMRRTVQTAEALKGICTFELEYQKEERLREVDLGRWEAKSYEEIVAIDPDLIPGWSRFEDFVFPGGESVACFTSRVADVLEELRSTGNKEIGVITHGGVIRTMICLALGLTPKNYLLFNVQPASLTILDLHSHGGVLSGLNL